MRENETMSFDEVDKLFPGIFKEASNNTIFYTDTNVSNRLYECVASYDVYGQLKQCRIDEYIPALSGVVLIADIHSDGNIEGDLYLELGVELGEESLLNFFKLNIDVCYNTSNTLYPSESTFYDREGIMRKYTIDEIIK